LGLYIVAEAIIFLPLIFMAVRLTDGSALKSAAITTGFLVLGISTLAFVTKKDFSFLGKYLTIFGFIALGTIIAGILFKFNLGV
jgi:FtsH-binding integral membrane protein